MPLEIARPAVGPELDDIVAVPAGVGERIRHEGAEALAAREAVLEAAYMSSYHQRLVVDDEAVGMLRAIARRVQSRAEENPELPIRYKAMLDFLASFQGGRKPGSKAAAAAAAAPAPAEGG